MLLTDIVLKEFEKMGLFDKKKNNGDNAAEAAVSNETEAGTAEIAEAPGQPQVKSGWKAKLASAKEKAMEKAGAAKDIAKEKAAAAKDIAIDKAGAAKAKAGDLVSSVRSGGDEESGSWKDRFHKVKNKASLLMSSIGWGDENSEALKEKLSGALSLIDKASEAGEAADDIKRELESIRSEAGDSVEAVKKKLAGALSILGDIAKKDENGESAVSRGLANLIGGDGSESGWRGKLSSVIKALDILSDDDDSNDHEAAEAFAETSAPALETSAPAPEKPASKEDRIAALKEKTVLSIDTDDLFERPDYADNAPKTIPDRLLATANDTPKPSFLRVCESNDYSEINRVMFMKLSGDFVLLDNDIPLCPAFVYDPTIDSKAEYLDPSEFNMPVIGIGPVMENFPEIRVAVRNYLANGTVDCIEGRHVDDLGGKMFLFRGFFDQPNTNSVNYAYAFSEKSGRLGDMIVLMYAPHICGTPLEKKLIAEVDELAETYLHENH